MRFVGAVAPAVLAALAGCSVGDPAAPEALDADAPSHVVPLVVVERTLSPAGTARQEAIAHFVRFRGVALEAAALHLTGAALDLPPPGACAAGERELGGPAQAIELVGAGAVTLETSAAKVALGPREILDPVGLVAGTVYAARAGDLFGEIDAARTRDALTLTVQGSIDVDSLAATAAPPPAPDSVRAATLASEDVSVDWLADDRPQGAIVYVDALTASGRRLLRCTQVEDDGRAILPAAALGGEVPATVVVHRVVRQPLSVRGAAQGELRVDVSRATFVVRGRG